MQEEMRIQDYIRLSWRNICKNLRLIAWVAILFLLIGTLVASLGSVENEYTAKTTVYIVTSSANKDVSAAAATATAISGYSEIVKSNKVCERAASIISDASVDAKVIKNIVSASFNKSSTIMTVSAKSGNPQIAKLVANAVAESFVEEVHMTLGSDMIRVLDKANEVSLSNDGIKGFVSTVAMAGIAGIAGCVALIVVFTVFSNKISCVEQCLDEEDSEVLGIIPFIK